MITGLFGAFELQADVDEVVGGRGAGVLEGELVVLDPDLSHLGVEGRLLVADHQEGRVHDHLVADGLVGPGGHAHVAELGEDVAHVTLGRAWSAASTMRPYWTRAK